MNEFPIQESKVQRPPLRDATLRRDRLLDWLHAKVHHRVVFVTAEAGYGKTTLISDFARRTRLRTLWYRLDDEDRDWISLLNYLVAAGRQVEPGFAPTTTSMLRELAAGGASRELIVETFARELAVFGTAGAVLILDDYHLVDDVPDVRDVMKEIVSRAPERLTFMLLSRRRPTIPLARMRALGELVELREEDLRFDAAETERLFREAYGTPLEPDVLVDLTQRTEGWAASLQLVHAAIVDRPRAEIRSFVRNLTGANAELHDYLAEEVVGVLDEELQDFLMRTSILQSMEPELACVAATVGEPKAIELIAEAERVGLLPPAGRARREGRGYHPLVRTFLEHRLRRDLGECGVRELHRSVAAYSEEWNWRLAAHHYRAADAGPDVNRVISASIRTIFGAGEYALAESYLGECLPSPHAPIFEMVQARMDLHRDDVPAALERARRAFASIPGGRSPSLSNLALANLFAVEFYAGHLEATLELAIQLAAREPEASLAAIAAGSIHILRASLDGALPDAATSLSEMARNQRLNGDLHYVGISLINLAQVDRARGDAVGAIEHADAAIDALSASSLSHELAAARMARAWGLAHIGRWADSMTELESASASPHALARAEILQEAADLHTWYGDQRVGRRLLDECPARAGAHDEVWMLSSAQNLVGAGRLGEAAHTLSLMSRTALTAEVGHGSRLRAVEAYLAVAAADPDAARLTAESLRSAVAQGSDLWAGFCRLLAGLLDRPEGTSSAVLATSRAQPAVLSMLADQVAKRLGDLDDAALSAVRDEALLRPLRWRAALRSVVDDDNRGSSRVQAGRILDEVGTADDVPRLRALARASRGRSHEPELGRRLARRLAPSVFVEDQGRVSVRVGDRLIDGSAIRRKVLALLCYLLSRPDISATRDQVLDALWPDLEPEVAANSLNQTVYFLRRVIEPAYQDDVSAEYLHHDSEVLWLDRDLVSSRSRVCAGLLRRIGTPAAPADVEMLAETYTGRFALDFAYEEWAGSYRDSLHAGYLEVIERAVHEDIDAGHFDRGISIARRAISVDPDADQLELALLRMYRLTGAHAAAAEQYGHYAAMLRDQLGLEAPPLSSI